MLSFPSSFLCRSFIPPLLSFSLCFLFAFCSSGIVIVFLKLSPQIEEEEDEIRKMNEMILQAKVYAIRDAQMQEKKAIKSELDQEQRRLDEVHYFLSNHHIFSFCVQLALCNFVIRCSCSCVFPLVFFLKKKNTSPTPFPCN